MKGIWLRILLTTREWIWWANIQTELLPTIYHQLGKQEIQMSGQENICSAFPWEMVPCQGNDVLMETPVVGQHKVRRGAREQREEEAEMEMYIYLCHLLFLLSSLKCHGCLCHIYSVCPWHFMPFKNLFICIAAVFQSVEINTHSILHVEFVFLS